MNGMNLQFKLFDWDVEVGDIEVLNLNIPKEITNYKYGSII